MVEGKVQECYYRTAKHSLETSEFHQAKCKDKENTDCTYEKICSDENTVDIRILNCRRFYIYYLKPIRKTVLHQISAASKLGTYCGSNVNKMPKPEG